MTIRKIKYVAVVWGMASCSFGAYAQEETESVDIFHDLISLISNQSVHSHAEPEESRVPEELIEIVSDFYTLQKQQSVYASNVLAYVSSVYSEHGYHETGSWVKNPPANRPVSYVYKLSDADFPLPKYDIADLKMPVNGAYTSFYGYRPKFGRFHKGIDIALNTGDSVRCVLPGIVVKKSYDAKGYGNYIVVSHDGGMETLYAHLTTGLVTPGQRIGAGDVVGLGGATGNATGPHLHFETRIEGDAVDPLYYLPKRDPRKK